ncbi:GNAT family N-acetyltransferase [Virgibacillus sp. C22-A2]|uniref:GNAT family N-acetyltransferase n=1 Tax=Virgibacillus tibetensis TaxID=3042313 RepID=A0ABU6KMD4_9BACI|nr:GNAT family N-acetyltransferase [Virgibacillus sp. C22-A2]
MTDTIEIRKLTTIKELQEIGKVEEVVWQASSIPFHQKYTVNNNGGIILGAFSEEKLIGFSYGFPGFDGVNTYLCSHMLGILPAYRKNGIGMKMKYKQAEIAEQIGYDMITWTFDPLESLNAYLNIHKLGAVGVRYNVDHYGPINDGLNKGMPTDRIVIEWRWKEKPHTKATMFNEDNVLLREGAGKKPVLTVKQKLDSDGYFVAIPKTIQNLKEEDIELAKKWRYETRKVITALFSNDYQATDLLQTQSNAISYYYFTKKA